MGVSLVIHPRNPHVPTIHMNIRYFEAGQVYWFGGGVDLTPYYPEVTRVREFHLKLKSHCDAFQISYDKLKKTCDDYFMLKHRKEMRGIGGLFFDNLKEGPENGSKEHIFRFVAGLGHLFNRLYEPFFTTYLHMPWTPAQREYQLWRRSRYAEFNLLLDRGTRFGIESEGRTESILMSLPSVCKWYYDYYPTEGTVEGNVHRFFLQPQDWVNPSGVEAPAVTNPTSDFVKANEEAKKASMNTALLLTAGFVAGIAATLSFGFLASRHR